jgi:hypothetical protein
VTVVTKDSAMARRISRLSAESAPSIWRLLVAPLLGYLSLTLALTYPLITQFGSAIPGDGFDGWQNYWNLWWIKRALVDSATSPFFTGLLYYPTGVSLLFHTLNPFNGLFTLPVQLTAGLIPAYNVAVLFCFSAGGFGAYLLALHSLGPGRYSRQAAFVAGLVFTFAPVHIAHLLGHLQVLSLEWIPFYTLYLLRIIKRRRARDARLAAFFLVLVALCDWYFVLYCAILTAVVLIYTGAATLVAGPAERLMARLRTGWGTVAAIAAVWLMFALIVSPVLVPMVREARQSRYMVPDPTQSRLLSADLLAFITPLEFHPVWGAWARAAGKLFSASPSEHQVFVGFSALALAGLGVWAGLKRRGKTGVIALWLLVLLSFFVLSLGPVLHIAGSSQFLPGGRELPLPYGWLSNHIPFMDITRSVSRFDIMVMLVIAVLAAWGVRLLLGLGRAGRAAGLLVSALLLFEFFPAPYPLSQPDTPAWYRTLLTDKRPGALLNLPMNWDRPGYLLYQTVHEKPLTVAYISREDPRTLTERAPVLQQLRHLGPDIIEFDLRQGRQVLNDLGIRWVVLDRYKMPSGRERSYTEETAAQVFAGQTPVYQDERLTVFEVTPPEQAIPYLVLASGWGAFDANQGGRTLLGSASLLIQAPAAGHVELRVKTAPGSLAMEMPYLNGAYVETLAVQAGANEVGLRTHDPGAQVVISGLAVRPAP